MIAVSCGIKIYAVRHLVLSQSTRVIDGQMDGQNNDSQNHHRIGSRGKNAIQYEICDTCVHCRCQGISEEAYTVLIGMNNLHWYCDVVTLQWEI